ncbi:acyl-CoA dehydrogenase family protein [Rhizorhapis suberifaciens]|uniref:Alkylation response protein AidB-like acyl-CoA dehydrogenase n=1 Tax=Rhizorhapis suberifaciens TaxID=13656 RepID=A0A840HZH0_9SPHN|nr:acyl-CoA dehydrogenase family protein [Rhizorhapis suberifaciens]MBB4642806.1 alkylation response protein AidB-like acyl-CoA dehydrogenase [Rhizorhapis suberifaciens]
MAQLNDIGLEANVALNAVERAQALQPLIAKHVEYAEQQGCIAPPVFDALKSAGLFWITAAKRVGGEGASMRTFVETVAEIGKTCPGSAWAYGIVTGATGTVASLPEAQRQLLFTKGDELCCFVGAKSGIAIRSGEGYSVSGQWPYASGCLHSNWAWCGVVVRDDKGVQVDSGFAFIDLSDKSVEIIRDWNVAGLSASGSNRVKADNHFVPADLFIRDSDMANMAGLVGESHAEARDFWPVEPQFGLTVLPSMLGAAEGMLEAVRQKMNDRPIIGWQYGRQSDSQLLLARLGEAAIKIDSAWMHVYRACDVLDRVAQEREVTKMEKVRTQVDCGYAMRLLREASETLLDIAGPGAFVLSNRIQGFWRDLNIGSRHNALNSGLSLELLGRALTGGKSNINNMPEI